MTGLIKVETPEQIADTAALARKIWIDHYVPIIGKVQVDYMLEKFQSERAIREQLADGYEYFLLRHEGLCAGYIAIVPADSGLMISKLYTDRSVRGSGLGRTMLNFAETVCREHGFSRLWLTVNKNNTASIEWYLRSGFKNSGSIVMDIGNGFVMDDYRMEKAISAL